MARLTVTEKIKNLFAKKGRIDDWDIPIDVVIENCPKCSARIEEVDSVWACPVCHAGYRGPVESCTNQLLVNPEAKLYETCGRLVHRVDDVYMCCGCKDRAEVEECMLEDAPGGYIPPALESTPPCGWWGRIADFARTWV